MRIQGNKICFKSLPRYYYREKSGVKNNTVRNLDLEESVSLIKLMMSTDKDLNISITNTESQECFTRHITDISTDPDTNVLIFTWDPNSGGNF